MKSGWNDGIGDLEWVRPPLEEANRGLGSSLFSLG